MKKYNFFYNGRAITKAQFISNVPENWEKEVDEFGCYSYGNYNVNEID